MNSWLLVVIHPKYTLLVAFNGLVMAGGYQPHGNRPDETQVDISFGLVAHRFVWTGSVQRGALIMKVRVSI